MRTRERENESGFTLMETLTVLAILALAVVISLPLLKTSGGAKNFRSEAQQIAAVFRLARIDAIAGNKETRVVIDLKNRRVGYPGRAAEIELGPETDIMVKTVRGEIMAQDAGFRFMPGGGATGGALFLKRQGNEATIAVSWLTGAVRIDYGGGR